ncbi:MAG: TRAP transporter small permease subunit [Pseudomonadota bacterium]
MFAAFQGLVTQLTRVTSYVATAANVAGTLVVLGLVVIVNYDIVARGVFNSPFRGAYEVVQFSMVLIVFLQLPDVIRVDRLTRSDGLLFLIGEKYPRASAMLRRVINTGSAIIMTLIAIAIFPEFLDMWDTQDFFGVPGIFTAPWWPIKLTIFCSATLAAIIFALKVLSTSGSDKPT